MRKLLMTLAVAGCSTLAVYAADIQRNTGAGIGTMIFQDQDGLVSQTLAITTNGTFCNGLFAITSGTLNAEKAPRLVKQERLENFVADNMDALAQDIAAGQGESLDTLAELMEVDAAKRAQFRVTLKSNFGKIYSTEAVTSQDVVTRISTLVEG
jgi:hypothetical protein